LLAYYFLFVVHKQFFVANRILPNLLLAGYKLLLHQVLLDYYLRVSVLGGVAVGLLFQGFKLRKWAPI
jgi:hypothetical protein